MKNRNILRKAALLIILTVVISCNAGCASADEALISLDGLIIRAEVINELVWGKGAEHEPYDDSGVSSGAARYIKVAPSCPFSSAAELVAEINAIYSKSYARIIREIAVEGSDAGAPRYYESDEGLTVNVNHNPFNLRTKLDPSNVKIKGRGLDRVEVVVACTFEGKPDSDYKITLVLEDGVWKLDSPTY